jgi:hypothetical protein
MGRQHGKPCAHVRASPIRSLLYVFRSAFKSNSRVSRCLRPRSVDPGVDRERPETVLERSLMMMGRSLRAHPVRNLFLFLFIFVAVSGLALPTAHAGPFVDAGHAPVAMADWAT